MTRRLSHEQAMEVMAGKAPNFVPSVPYQGNKKPWPGVCMDCGQPIKPMYNSIQQGQSACKYCSGHAVDGAVAVGRMMAKDLMPLVPYPGANHKPWLCKCMNPDCGAQVEATLHNAKDWGGCWNCAFILPAAGQSLADLRPELATEAHGWDPSQVKLSSAIEMEWKCSDSDCGYIWKAKIYHRATGDRPSGCPNCASSGYKVTVPGYFYFIAGGGWLKGGITNSPDGRLANHRSQGLTEVLHLWHYDDGNVPVALERRWVEHINAMPPEARPLKHQVKDGYTESVKHTPDLEVWINDVFKPLAESSTRQPSIASESDPLEATDKQRTTPLPP